MVRIDMQPTLNLTGRDSGTRRGTRLFDWSTYACVSPRLIHCSDRIPYRSHSN